jgi:hypothetical protein
MIGQRYQQKVELICQGNGVEVPEAKKWAK